MSKSSKPEKVEEATDDPPFVATKDCFTTHLKLENRLTKLENRQLTEIVILIAGFAIVIFKLCGI